MDKLQQSPIFIAGEGRSGTTLLFRLLALHPDLGWINSWTAQYPGNTYFSFFSRFYNFDWFELRFRDAKFFPRPAREALNLLDYCFPNPRFSNAVTEWTENDVTVEGSRKLKSIVTAYCKWQGKSRFLAKYTGYMSISFMKVIFPDSIFLQISRDPRAVVFSYLVKGWRFGYPIDQFQKLSRIEKLEFLSGMYNRYYESRKKYNSPQDYLGVSYEELIANPIDKIKMVCEYINLPVNHHYLKRLSSWSLKMNTNDLYKVELNDKEQGLLDDLLHGPILEMGYHE